MPRFAAVPSLLVRHKVDELRPACITNRLSQVVIRHHAFDIQVFKGNRGKVVHQLATQSMVKVKPLVGNLLVRSRQALTSIFDLPVAFVVVDPEIVFLSGFQLATQTTTANLQDSFGIPVELGCFNGSTWFAGSRLEAGPLWGRLAERQLTKRVLSLSKDAEVLATIRQGDEVFQSQVDSQLRQWFLVSVRQLHIRIAGRQNTYLSWFSTR